MDEMATEEVKDTINSVNEKLDEILLEFFDTLEHLYQQQESLDEQMKNGFLQMSRARYNMGVKAIGASQFNEKEMTSLYSVDLTGSENIDSDIFVLNSEKFGRNKSTEDRDSEIQNGGGKSDKSGLRKRNVDNSEKVDESKSLNETVETIGQRSDISNEVAADQPPLQDPIKWFGVLVPQSLRQSQTSFRQSIKTVVNIANLQNKLHILRNQYTDLMSQKQSLNEKV